MDENEHQGRAGGGEPSIILHASAVALAGRGVLILGGSGSGKSALALRLIATGARLVADDRVLIRGRSDGALIAAAPAAIAGLIEARFVGILRAPHVAEAPVSLVVDLDAAAEARLPQKRTIMLLDREIGLIPGKNVPNLDAIITVVMIGGGVAT
jgi:HPr kinase/phosphorylase